MMINKAAIWMGVIALAIGGASAEARPKVDTPNNKALDPIIACRSLANADTRLACYDNSIAALQSATAKHDIVVIDQQDVAKARRSLFGFSLPSFDFLGHGNNDDAHNTSPEDSRLVATIRSVRQDGDGNWIFVLDDGAVWHQTTGFLAVSPKAAETVEIRRAALGSYFMRVGHQPGFKAKRDS